MLCCVVRTSLCCVVRLCLCCRVFLMCSWKAGEGGDWSIRCLVTFPSPLQLCPWQGYIYIVLVLGVGGVGAGVGERLYIYWVMVSFTTTVSPPGSVAVWQVTKVRCLARIMDRLLSAASARSSAASSSLWNLRTRVRLVEDTDS